VAARKALRRLASGCHQATLAAREETVTSLQESLVIADRKLRRSASKAQAMTEQTEEGYQVVIEAMKQEHRLELEGGARRHRDEVNATNATHAQEVQGLVQSLEQERSSLALAGTEAHVASLERQIDRYKEAFSGAQVMQHRLREELDIATIDAANKEMEGTGRVPRESREEESREEEERLRRELEEARRGLEETEARLAGVEEECAAYREREKMQPRAAGTPPGPPDESRVHMVHIGPVAPAILAPDPVPLRHGDAMLPIHLAQVTAEKVELASQLEQLKAALQETERQCVRAHEMALGKDAADNESAVLREEAAVREREVAQLQEALLKQTADTESAMKATSNRREEYLQTKIVEEAAKKEAVKIELERTTKVLQAEHNKCISAERAAVRGVAGLTNGCSLLTAATEQKQHSDWGQLRAAFLPLHGSFEELVRVEEDMVRGVTAATLQTSMQEGQLAELSDAFDKLAHHCMGLVDAMSQEKTELQECHYGLQERLTKMATDFESLQDTHCVSLHQARELQSELQDTQLQKQLVETQLEETKQAESQLEAEMGEHAVQEARLRESLDLFEAFAEDERNARSLLSESKIRLEASTQREQAQEEALEVARRAVRMSDTALHQSERDAKLLQEALEDVTQEAKSYSDELIDARRSRAAEIQELRRSKAHVVAEIEQDVGAVVTELEDELTAMRISNSKLMLQYQKASQDLATATDKCSHLEGCATRLIEVENQLSVNNRLMTTALTDAEDAVFASFLKVENMTERCEREVSDAETKLAGMEIAAGELRKEMLAIKQRCLNSEDLMLSQAENETLAIERGLENTAQDLKHKEEECRRLHASCTRLERDKAELGSLLEQARTECDRLELVAEEAVVVAEQSAVHRTGGPTGLQPSLSAMPSGVALLPPPPPPFVEELASEPLDAAEEPAAPDLLSASCHAMPVGESPNPLYSPLHDSTHTAHRAAGTPSLGMSQLELGTQAAHVICPAGEASAECPRCSEQLAMLTQGQALMQRMYGHATGLRALATEIYSSLVSRQETPPRGLGLLLAQMRTAAQGPTLLDEAFRAVMAAQGRQDTDGAVEGAAGMLDGVQHDLSQMKAANVLLAQSLAHAEAQFEALKGKSHETIEELTKERDDLREQYLHACLLGSRVHAGMGGGGDMSFAGVDSMIDPASLSFLDREASSSRVGQTIDRLSASGMMQYELPPDW